MYTIGFTKKSAREFFETLINAGVRRVVDIRLNNVSQLAGFTKRDDLAYFLDRIGSIEYVHVPLLAPTAELLDSYKKGQLAWADFEAAFHRMLEECAVEQAWLPQVRDADCLLCSEHEPDRCHRRMVADYLSARDSRIAVQHLL